MKPNWYQIKAQGERKAEILLYEMIGEDFWGEGIGARRFAEDLKALGELDEITVRINSPGGNVFDGNAIFNVLRAHAARVLVSIDGIAASIASVVAMAGETVTMPENAMMMVHDPAGLTIGTADDMRKTAEALDKVKEGLMLAYIGKTGMSRDEIAELMSDETWMTAEEAVEWGFADEMAEPVRLAAHHDLSKFHNIPKGLQAATSGRGRKSGAHGGVNVGDISMSVKQIDSEKITREFIAEQYPAIADAFRAEGRDEFRAHIGDDEKAKVLVNEARALGARAECERIKAVEDQLIPGHEDLIAEMKFDGETTGEQAAVKVLQAEKGKRGQMIDKLRGDSPPVVAAAVPPVVSDAEEKKDFWALVRERTDKGEKKAAAIKAVISEHPDVHEEWVARQNEQAKAS